jgi:hypothetical protein
MASIKTASVKLSCTSCNKEFTKDTLDKNNGICGRCANKKTEISTLVTAAPVTLYEFPEQLMKLAHVNISNSNLSLSTRLENWYKSTCNANEKNNAAAEIVYLEYQSKIKVYEKIKNVGLINFEKLLSNSHKLLAE